MASPCPPLFCFHAAEGSRRIHEKQNRPVKFFRLLHETPGFPVALRGNHTEIAFHIFFRAVAFFLGNDRHRLSLEKGQAADDRRVVPETAISMKFQETVKKEGQEICASRPFRRPGQSDMIPGLQFFCGGAAGEDCGEGVAEG